MLNLEEPKKLGIDVDTRKGREKGYQLLDRIEELKNLNNSKKDV